MADVQVDHDRDPTNQTQTLQKVDVRDDDLSRKTCPSALTRREKKVERKTHEINDPQQAQDDISRRLRFQHLKNGEHAVVDDKLRLHLRHVGYDVELDEKNNKKATVSATTSQSV